MVALRGGLRRRWWRPRRWGPSQVNLLFVLEALLVATEGGLCILGYRLATAGVVKALGGVDASLCKMSTVNLSSYVWCCVHVVAVEPRRFRQ